MARQIIVVDVETNGLDVEHHDAFEVAWWNLSTGESDVFIPPHSPNKLLASADIKALQINRYLDRIPGWPQDTSGQKATRLSEALEGNTFAGANPRFDEKFLTKMFRTYWCEGDPVFIPTPHYRLWDLESYAAAFLTTLEVPGVREIATALGIEMPDHTAGRDVDVEGRCFLEIWERLGIAPHHAAETEVPA